MMRHLRAYIVVASALLIIAAVVLAQNAAQSYPSLDASGMQQVAKTSLGTQFDLLLLRLDPAIIDNKRFIRFFILLNNCDQRDGGLKMKNSLSSKFAGIAAFYKSKAAQVAAIVSTSTNIIMANYPGAANRPTRLFLGDCNMSTNAFSFVDNQRNPGTVQSRPVCNRERA